GSRFATRGANLILEDDNVIDVLDASCRSKHFSSIAPPHFWNAGRWLASSDTRTTAGVAGH
ncbi:MAG: hypothetical protein P8X53_07405, partial [Chromatiales bacterium]